MSTVRSDMIAPHKPENEEAVLGAVLLRPDIFGDLAAIVDSSDFFLIRHQWIWEAITTIKKRREPIDYLTVVSELEKTNRLSEVGGAAYIVGLTNKTPSALNYEGYAKYVQRDAIRRRLLDKLQISAQRAYDGGLTIEDMLEGALTDIGAVADRHYAVNAQVESTGDALLRLLTLADERAANPIDVKGLPSGIPRFDASLGGYRQGEMHIIAARPGMGKSSVAAQGAYGQARDGITVCVFSLEMSRDEMLHRMASQAAMVPADAIEKGYATPEQLGRYKSVVQDMLTWQERLIIIDTPALTVSTMKGLHRAENRKLRGRRIDCVYVDTLNKVKPSKESGDNAYNQITAISRAIHAWAKEEHVAIVVMAQLSRGVEKREDKRPMLSDLRDSGSLEEDAYTVTFLYREGYYNEKATYEKRVVHGQERYIDMSKTIEFIIAKNRGSQLATFMMWWFGESFVVQEIAMDQLPTSV